jgi:hypothetical protein
MATENIQNIAKRKSIAWHGKHKESERLLATLAVSYHGWRSKAVALLRHLENQKPVWPHKYPDSELARRALVPQLTEMITVGTD